MKTKKSKTVVLCRAGIIAACYAALTMAFGQLSYGPLQVRPSEALCLLPIFFPEAIPGLFVGCMLGNVLSGYGIYDILLGSLTTLLAAAFTYLSGKVFKRGAFSVIFGGLPPVLLNAFCIPLIVILAGDKSGAYWVNFIQLLFTQTVWIYLLGVPLFLGIRRLRNNGNKYLL